MGQPDYFSIKPNFHRGTDHSQEKRAHHHNHDKGHGHNGQKPKYKLKKTFIEEFHMTIEDRDI